MSILQGFSRDMGSLRKVQFGSNTHLIQVFCTVRPQFKNLFYQSQRLCSNFLIRRTQRAGKYIGKTK